MYYSNIWVVEFAGLMFIDFLFFSASPRQVVTPLRVGSGLFRRRRSRGGIPKEHDHPWGLAVLYGAPCLPSAQDFPVQDFSHLASQRLPEKIRPPSTSTARSIGHLPAVCPDLRSPQPALGGPSGSERRSLSPEATTTTTGGCKA